jgi:Na+/H+ antiporter NhaD/arsenite permease-like protein
LPASENSATRAVVTLAVFTTMHGPVVVRPRCWNEAWWTVLAAGATLALGLISPRQALDATLAGKSALLFLLSLLVRRSWSASF